MTNLVNQRFGIGIVISKVPKPQHLKRRGNYWLVKCDCGGESVVDTSTLKYKWKCCGCSENLIGQTFHDGTVIDRGETKNHKKSWTLRCKCGQLYTALTESLKSNNTKSCGCRNHLKGKLNSKYKGYEDLSGDYWTKTRRGAKNRNIAFNLSIKDAWELFISQKSKCALTGWDISLLRRNQSQTASLDRKDSTKEYCLENVQWVHKDVNRIKLNYNEEYFISICKAIALRR